MAPPKQSTLGQFFGVPGNARPTPPQQTRLTFATRTPSSSSKENVAPDKDTGKKRPSPAREDAVVVSSGQDDGQADQPAAKRARRGRRTLVDEDDEDMQDDVVEVKKEEVEREDRKKVIKREQIKKEAEREDKREQIKKEEEDRATVADSAPLPATKREDAAAASSSSEAEMESDEEEDEEEDEDEDEDGSTARQKPAAAAAATTAGKGTAKARKEMQTLLASLGKTAAYPDWKAGEAVPYAALCRTFSLIELTSKRLVIMEHCSLFLQQVLRLTPQDLLPTVLLMVNKLAPDYAGIELGIGESLIMKAIGETTGRSLAVIKQDQKEIGDLGLVAVKSRSTQPTMFRPKPLTVAGVHKGLMAIATVTGNGAQQRKVDGIKKLLSAADTAGGSASSSSSSGGGGRVDITKDKGGASEAKYIVRFLEGKLRLGLAEKTVLVSLAQAVVHHEARTRAEAAGAAGAGAEAAEVEKAEAVLKSVYSELPSYDVIVPAMLEHGIMHLREHCKLRPGVPLKPMLAKPTKAITEVLDRFENQTFTCEYKYDGERAQIHYVAAAQDAASAAASGTLQTLKTATANNGLAAIFSRNSEDLSKKYPDILGKLATWVGAGTTSFVLDCETVAWDVAERKVLPFQQLMTRKRKDVRVEDVKIKVCVFAFDLLYLNGEALVALPLRERRARLAAAFTPVEGEFAMATHMDGQELDAIQAFLDESVKASCEGLMVKMLDGAESAYEPSKRSRNWLKIKKDYLSGVGDSLDLVVLGAYYGRGKRTSVYGAFLLACYNPGTDTYETICNIGTGFSEAVLDELHAQLSQLVIARPKPFYAHSAGNQHQPDVWFEPRFVWEVRTADLTLSPRYKAASGEGVDSGGDENRGISLRFPRFIRIRDDKNPDQATTSRQVAEMYRKQESVAKSKGPAVDDDFEY